MQADNKPGPGRKSKRPSKDPPTNSARTPGTVPECGPQDMDVIDTDHTTNSLALRNAEFRPSQVDFAWGYSASPNPPPRAATAALPSDFPPLNDLPVPFITTPYGSLDYPIQQELDPL